MNTHESERASREARGDLTSKRARSSRYSDAALQYLVESAYLESHRREPKPKAEQGTGTKGDAGEQRRADRDD